MEKRDFPFAPRVSILTAGRDPHYSLGLASALAARAVNFDFIGGDDQASIDLRQSARVNFVNLRGDSKETAPLWQKIRRVLVYYFRLVAYAATSRAGVFHILWNNKFELFDRTLLMVFYKWCGKKIAFTAHNVNAGRRDGCDSFLNRLSLRAQYRLCDRIFVHTDKMKNELISDFRVPENRIVMIPFGINDAVPRTALAGAEARRQIGLNASDRVILFFGNIAPYKGLEYLVEAFETIARQDPLARLVVAGQPKGPPAYWTGIQKIIADKFPAGRVIQKIEYICDADIEAYFKAADVLVLPYVSIFQSGVLFLGYSFGLPVIATDVGSLKEGIVEGKTGFVCEPQNAADLARAIQFYFRSDLFCDLESRRHEILSYAIKKHSWSEVSAVTWAVYEELLRENESPRPLPREERNDETLGLNSHSGLQQ